MEQESSMKPTPSEVLRALADGKVVEDEDGLHNRMSGCKLESRGDDGEWGASLIDIEDLLDNYATRIIEPDHTADVNKKVEPELTHDDEPKTLCDEVRDIWSTPELVDAMNAANAQLVELLEREKAKDGLLKILVEIEMGKYWEGPTTPDVAFSHLKQLKEKAFPEEP
jgi:hypothetical protein